MKVYVIMGNDFPDAVFGSEAAAKAYVAGKKEGPENKNHFGKTRIYWRFYEVEVQK